MKTKRRIALLIVAIMFVMALNLNSISFAAETLQSKIDAIETSGEVKLDADYTDAITIPAGKTITLDLNGHNLTVTGADAISNKGTLTIKGSGKVNAESNGYGVIVNYPGATCTVDGGDYLAKGWYTIKNMGEMTINNLTFKNDVANGASMIDNGYVGSTASDRGEVATASSKVLLTINGGTFENYGNSCNTIKNDDMGVLEINGGTFTSKSENPDNGNPALMNWYKATINGGTFNSQKVVVANGFLDATYDVGELTINGGTFNASGNNYLFGLNGSAKANNGFVEIKGGIFNGPVQDEAKYTAGGTEYYTFKISGGTFDSALSKGLVEGYTAYKTTDGKYTVDKKAELTVAPVFVTVGGSVDVEVSGAEGLEDYLSMAMGENDFASLEDGKVTGKDVGTTEVTVSLSDGTEVKAPVTVIDPVIAPADENDEENVAVNDMIVAAVNEALEAETEELPVGMTEELTDKIAQAWIDGLNVKTRIVKDGNIQSSDNLTADVKATAPEGSKMDAVYEVTIEVYTVDASGNEVDVLGTVTELNSKAEIVLTLSKDIPQVEEGYERTYSVVRFHQDEDPVVLPAKDNGDGTITVESDKFSTYVITYVDTLAKTDEEEKPADTTEETTVPAEEKKEEASNPKTGDIIMSVVAVFAIASVALVVADKKRKNI